MTNYIKGAKQTMGRLIKIPKGLEHGSVNKPFFNRVSGRSFEIRAQENILEIDLYDEIGFFGVTAKSFKNAIKGAKDIHLFINSPGGDIFDGITIYNDLVSHRRKTKGEVVVEINGVAASAASVVAMAGDRINIAQNGFIMIHNAWGMTVGNKNDHEQMVGELEKIDKEIARTYSNRTGMDIDEVLGLMDEETWFNSEESVENGFADETLEGVEAKTRFDLSGFFKNVPDDFSGLNDNFKDEDLILEKVERNIGILI